MSGVCQYAPIIDRCLRVLAQVPPILDAFLFAGLCHARFIARFPGDLNHEAQIVSWKNMTSIDVWTDSYCNAINGTDGTMFHPFVEKNETIYMFTNDICRSIYAQYVQDVTVKGWSFKMLV